MRVEGEENIGKYSEGASPPPRRPKTALVPSPFSWFGGSFRPQDCTKIAVRVVLTSPGTVSTHTHTDRQRGENMGFDTLSDYGRNCALKTCVVLVGNTQPPNQATIQCCVGSVEKG